MYTKTTTTTAMTARPGSGRPQPATHPLWEDDDSPADPVERVLADGARKAREEARKTMTLVREKVGLPPRPVEG